MLQNKTSIKSGKIYKSIQKANIILHYNYMIHMYKTSGSFSRCLCYNVLAVIIVLHQNISNKYPYFSLIYISQ